MNKIKLITALLLLTFAFSSCVDEITNEYNNANDPESPMYILPGPADLKVKVIDENHIELNWTIKSHKDQGFIIERSDGDSTAFKEVGNVPPKTATYIDNFSFQQNHTYKYRVKAIGAKFTPYSQTVKVEFVFALPKNITFPGRTENNSISVAWSKLEYGNLVIQKKLHSDIDYQIVAELPPSDTSYTIDGLDSENVYDIRFYVKGERLVTSFSRRYAFVYGFEKVDQTEFSQNKNGTYVDFSPNNDLFLVAGKLDIFSLNNNSIYLSTSFIGDEAKFFPDGSKVILSATHKLNVGGETVRVINTTSGAIVDNLNYTAQTLDANKNMSEVYLASFPYGIRSDYLVKIDYPSKNILWKIDNAKVRKLKYSESLNEVICLKDDSKDTINIYNGSTGNLVSSIPGGGNISLLDVSPNGKYMLYSAGGTIHIWDLESFGNIKNIAIPSYTASFSQDSKYILFSDNLDLMFYDFQNNMIVGKITSAYGYNYATASNNLEYIAAAQYDDKAILYKMQHAWYLL